MVQPLINTLGAEITFGALAVATTLVMFLFILEGCKGEGWRKAKKERLAVWKKAIELAEEERIIAGNDKK